MLFNGIYYAIKFVNYYDSTILKAIEGKELKILTPKQMLQRLPIILVQV